MIKISAKTGGESAPEVVLLFPDGPNELPLNRYIDFFAAVRRMQWANPYQEMSLAIAAFAGCEVDQISTITMGEGALRKLYAFALQQLQKWVPTNQKSMEVHFTHKDERYTVKDFLRPESDLTVAEAVEAFETIRSYGTAIEKSATVTDLAVAYSYDAENEDLKKRLQAAIPDKAIDPGETAEIVTKYGDPDGSLAYSRYLKLIAIFARKDGEVLPGNDLERKAFISDRMRTFDGLDTKTALDIDFFLHNTFKQCGRTPLCIGSLHLPLLEGAVEMSVVNARHFPALSKRKKKSLTKRVGERL